MTQVPQSAVRHHQYQTVTLQKTANLNPLHYQHKEKPEQRPLVVQPPPNPQKQTQILSSRQTQATLSLNLTLILTSQFHLHISVNEDWLDELISIDAANHNVKAGTESELAKTMSKFEERWEISGVCDCFWEVTCVIILIQVLIILVLVLKIVVKGEEAEEEEEEEELSRYLSIDCSLSDLV